MRTLHWPGTTSVISSGDGCFAFSPISVETHSRRGDAGGAALSRMTLPLKGRLRLPMHRQPDDAEHPARRPVALLELTDHAELA